MVQVSLLALGAMLTLVSCDVTSQESLSGLDRLVMMEQQLHQLNDVNHQLRQQNDAIQQLRQKNDVQAARLSDLDHLNQSLMSKLSQQEDRLTVQEKTIRLQGSELSHLKVIIAKVLTNNYTLVKSSKSTSAQSGRKQDWGSSVTSTHHDVNARSDDTGAVGVVVNEINQRVTQMSADIQTMKNTDIKHASDIQALKNTDIKHDSDIQALKASRTSDMHAMTLTNKHQDQDIHDARSSSFVRWGSSHCPHNSSLVYSGVVGGSHFAHPGTAVNYLCLTMSPVFGHPRHSSYVALLYGGEYGGMDDSHQDKDPLCAVCRASFSTTIMVPGTNVCTSGWTPLYSGYLMAGDDLHKGSGSEFVCVDATLESRPGSVNDEDGILFHFTVTRCGSLPCGPYVNDKVVTCVVCGQ